MSGKCQETASRRVQCTPYTEVSWHSMFSCTNVVIIPHCCPDKGFKGTVVNRTCLFMNGRSLTIQFTFPLSEKPLRELSISYYVKYQCSEVFTLSAGSNSFFTGEVGRRTPLGVAPVATGAPGAPVDGVAPAVGGDSPRWLSWD